MRDRQPRRHRNHWDRTEAERFDRWFSETVESVDALTLAATVRITGDGPSELAEKLSASDPRRLQYLRMKLAEIVVRIRDWDDQLDDIDPNSFGREP
jgi:hypothetical protein